MIYKLLNYKSDCYKTNILDFLYIVSLAKL